jgi:hypothetical protein
VPDTACTNVDCGPGYQCAVECTNNTCQTVCEPITGPGDCTGAILCNAAPPACPTGTTPGIANGCYTGYCIPNIYCGSPDPGRCYDPVLCNSAPPQCPSGTLPGVANGCYTGYCIPTASCEMPACETLTTEAQCTARGDCNAVYAGMNCTCDPDCTCQTLTYERCESALMPL